MKNEQVGIMTQKCNLITLKLLLCCFFAEEVKKNIYMLQDITLTRKKTLAVSENSHTQLTKSDDIFFHRNKNKVRGFSGENGRTAIRHIWISFQEY